MRDAWRSDDGALPFSPESSKNEAVFRSFFRRAWPRSTRSSEAARTVRPCLLNIPARTSYRCFSGMYAGSDVQAFEPSEPAAHSPQAFHLGSSLGKFWTSRTLGGFPTSHKVEIVRDQCLLVEAAVAVLEDARRRRRVACQCCVRCCRHDRRERGGEGAAAKVKRRSSFAAVTA